MMYVVIVFLLLMLVYQRHLIVSNRKIRHKISHDELTGLCNWDHFLHKAELLLKTDKERYFICSNIVDFKLINELFGRDVGNQILKKEAELMIEFADENCVYGRRSDDNFIMIIDKDRYDVNHFKYFAQQLQKVLNNSVYKMHVCFGVYEINTNTQETLDSICDKAYIAIQSIKDNYQQLVAFYDESLLEQAFKEQSIVGEFDQAIQNGNFKMYLQPQIVSTKNKGNKVIGAEALVRWEKEDGTVVPPDDFIGVYEKTGMIYRLDRYMWELAARKLSQWKKLGIDTKISVNISVRDLYYLDLYEEFIFLVKKYDIEPKKLNIEITESILMSEATDIKDKIEKLQKAGFVIEIDDFGSGYSSLNTLKDIQVDVLKIDREFLRETENEKRSRMILNSIISMAKSLGMYVITEGVETKEQIEYLTDMGCDVFQGYYFSKPLSIETFEKKYLGKA